MSEHEDWTPMTREDGTLDPEHPAVVRAVEAIERRLADLGWRSWDGER